MQYGSPRDGRQRRRLCSCWPPRRPARAAPCPSPPWCSVRPRTDTWQPDIVSNGLFEEYYKGQDICPPEVRLGCWQPRQQGTPTSAGSRCSFAAGQVSVHSSGTLQTSRPAAAARVQEWEAFIAALKRPLPITFRINGQGKFADRLVARLESNFMQQFTEEPVVVSGASCQGCAACRAACTEGLIFEQQRAP